MLICALQRTILKGVRPGRPKRLPRDRYIGERTVAFHVSVEERRNLFTSDEVVGALVERMARAASEFDCVVPIYCFMPDHAHIMFKGLAEHSDLLAAMVKFKSLSGFWLYKLGLPSLQQDFFDHVMRVGDDWRNHALYIANNPVRAGLANDWSQYPYTGAIGCDLQDIVSGFR